MSTRYPTTLSFWEKAVLIYVLFRARKTFASKLCSILLKQSQWALVSEH